MNKKKTMSVFSWIMGVVFCPLGIAFCTKADFGLSMIAAPAFIWSSALHEKYPVLTQGTCEYLWQAALLVLLCIIIRRFRFSFLLSFVTAFLSGKFIDVWLSVLGGNTPYESMVIRIVSFILGEIILGCAIAFYFRTTLPLQVYELAVVQISEKWSIKKEKVKYANDIIMLIISLILSFTLTHKLTGIGIGTVIITVVNSPIILCCGFMIDKIFKINNLNFKQKQNGA